MKCEPLDYVTKTILTILMCYYVLSLLFKPIYQTCKYKRNTDSSGVTRWRDLVGDGPTTGWEGGIYEGFCLVRENGRWKIDIGK